MITGLRCCNNLSREKALIADVLFCIVCERLMYSPANLLIMMGRTRAFPNCALLAIGCMRWAGSACGETWCESALTEQAIQHATITYEYNSCTCPLQGVNLLSDRFCVAI